MANNWKINKTVDLARGIDGVEVWPHALLVTGDENAHEWNVTVMDNGKPASLGGSIRAYFVRSDGATVTASGSVSSNVATVTLPEACYAYEGDLQAVMQLIEDDVSVTLSALLLRVRQITTDVIIDPGTEIPSLDDLLAQIESMKQATKDAGEATSKANTAASNADAATEKANASASAADASKAAADTAANAANEAAERANKAASGVGIRKKIVDALPAKVEMEQDVLYLVRRAEPNDDNIYDEYMLINGEIEAIGSTKTDLEDYAKKDELAKVATSGSYNDLIEKPELAKVATSGSFADLTGTEGVATKEYVGEQIDAVEIGGTNLFRDSGNLSSIISGRGVFANSSWGHLNRGTITRVEINDAPNNNIHFGAHLEKANEGVDVNKLVTLNQDQVPLSIGQTYTVSYYVKGSGSSWINYEAKGSTPKSSPRITASNEWKRHSLTFVAEGASYFLGFYTENDGDITICGMKLEVGNKATDWSPAPEDVDHAISRRAVVTYDYGGKNLKEVFGTAEALHNALAAEDYSQIAVGDYWPITLTGTFWDYGSYTVKSGVKYYSNNTLQAEAGTTAATYEGAYASNTAVSFVLSGSTYYVNTSDCLPYFARTCNNVAVKLEVAGINHYWRYGDKGELSSNKPHIVFISRDCLPFIMRARKSNGVWEDTQINNPWLGSALFKTFNDNEHGILKLLESTDVGEFIYAGPNNKGMRARIEKKGPNDISASNFIWLDRGKLFIPTISEVAGQPLFLDVSGNTNPLATSWASSPASQFEIFIGSFRHVAKGFGDGGSRAIWRLASTSQVDGSSFSHVDANGNFGLGSTQDMLGIVLCFVFV